MAEMSGNLWRERGPEAQRDEDGESTGKVSITDAIAAAIRIQTLGRSDERSRGRRRRHRCLRHLFPFVLGAEVRDDVFPEEA
jgi:hypothetical protein